MVGQRHGLNGHEFEQALEGGEGQESLACCSPWGHKESDMTERLNSNNKFYLPQSWLRDHSLSSFACWSIVLGFSSQGKWTQIIEALHSTVMDARNELTRTL